MNEWSCFTMEQYASYTAAFKLKANEYVLKHRNDNAGRNLRWWSSST